MLLNNIRKIEPTTARCITVESHDRLFEVGVGDKAVLTHNSVAQQNIIISCLLRPEYWVIMGIDLKRVELSRYRKFGMKVATDLDSAIEFLRFAQAVMMKRYERMEEFGVNDFLDLPERSQALLVMIDEAGELLSPSGAKALSEYTKVHTVNGYKLLKDVKIGDMLVDNYGNPTKVLNKYEPEEQARFTMKITSDSTGKSEEFISGEEHYWVVYLEHPNGELEGPMTIETKELKRMADEENMKPIEERAKFKIKRG